MELQAAMRLLCIIHLEGICQEEDSTEEKQYLACLRKCPGCILNRNKMLRIAKKEVKDIKMVFIDQSNLG